MTAKITPPAAALLGAGHRWYGFLQQRFEEAGRMPKYHRMLGETYGRFVVHAEHGDRVAMDYLEWMRVEAQQFDGHPDFPGRRGTQNRPGASA
ncbi:hypothetical protein GCM10010274_58280 [Streptomyces lavendofoliae]|uniref:Uncharacterized protein n=1 Tax=Streptomyces lavendofoliae TaxID=67314 RepID=A0A918M7R4_9ACTN|nr:hypothetical protein GCM10010274_58280 [Streptomyces lavendofoliae]